MILALSLFALVVLILFVLTWYNISTRADAGQYAQTCGHIDDDRRKLRELVRNHEGYGQLQQHVAALDQIVTLQLAPSGDGSEESYFFIPTPDQYKVGYAMCAKIGYEDSKPQSTERSLTLRELLNRVLKDIPVELVHPVEADWKFKEEPIPPPSPPFLVPMTPYAIDNSPVLTSRQGAPLSFLEMFGIVPKPVVFSPHFCGLDTGFTDQN